MTLHVDAKSACVIAAAACELLAGFNVSFNIGSKDHQRTINFMCLGFFFVIVAVMVL